MMMPDQAPQIEGDKTGLAFAFEMGYVQSIIQNREKRDLIENQ
jgi:hypothetical protein